MTARRRGTTATIRNRKIAGGLLAAAVAAGTAYAVPSAAQAAPAQAPVAGHHLSTRLAALVAGTDGQAPAANGAQLTPLESGAGSLLRTLDGRVVVDVRLSSYDAGKVDAVKAAGGRILARTPSLRQVTVAVAPADLSAVGDAAGVEYVGEELTPQTSAACDTTLSQGDAILHANQLRATGMDGTGVKVGVLSDSYNKFAGAFTTAPADIVSDNLPGAANTCGHTTVSTTADKPTAGTDEGRGMMQIVHDLAPGSPLDFATAFVSEPSFASNITALANQGAKVIVDDVTYFDEPMYQDGVVEQAITGVRAQGVDYFSSSANNRMILNNHEVGSYEAVNGYRPTPCPAYVTGHADCHNFGTAGSPDSTFTYLPNNGQTIRAIMNWAEPWFGVNTDLDLFLVDQTAGAVLTSSSTVNTGGGSQQTFEGLSGTQNNPGGDQWAFIVARKSSVAPATTPRFKIIFANNGVQSFSTLEREVPDAGTGDVMGPNAFGHNGGADVMSVGASDVRVATNLNSYSSYGPVTTLFGPVNGSTPAAPLATPRVVAKPDLVASDCNVTTFFAGAGPPFHFCGTSAAAPHAAAVAALLRSSYPTATVAQITTAMVTTATPIGGVPASFQGGGLVNALAAGGAITTTPAAPVPTGTDLASPNSSTTPKVKGNAVLGSLVKLYTTADCSGSPAATGTAAAFHSTGLGVTVGVGSTSSFRATATTGGGTSACSTASVSYAQQNAPPPAPDTTITKTPKKTVKTTKSKVKVSFGFASTIAGSTFACSIDGKAFAPCTSGVTYKLKAGKHTFAVRATASGVSDPTPATFAFKVKRKKHHH